MEELIRLLEKRDKAAERLLWCIQMAKAIVLCLRGAEDAEISDRMKGYWINQNNLSE